MRACQDRNKSCASSSWTKYNKYKTMISYLIVFTRIISIHKYTLNSILRHKVLHLRALKCDRGHQPSESVAGFHDANFHMTLTSATLPSCNFLCWSYSWSWWKPMSRFRQQCKLPCDTETSSAAAQRCKKIWIPISFRIIIQSTLYILVILTNTPGAGVLFVRYKSKSTPYMWVLIV